MKRIIENWNKFLNEQGAMDQQAAQWLADQIAPLIAAADSGNFSQPLLQLVQRLNTPEGTSPAVRALLRRGDMDGDTNDEVVKVLEKQAIPAPQLDPHAGCYRLVQVGRIQWLKRRKACKSVIAMGSPEHRRFSQPEMAANTISSMAITGGRGLRCLMSIARFRLI